MTVRTTGVLAAVDRSECSHEALRWAAADAAAAGTDLTVATVVDLPGLVEVPLSPGMFAAEERAARRAVDAAVDRARVMAPDVAVDGVVRSGDPAAELIRLAGDARELVVGSHGHSGITGLLIGSVSCRVAEHASCPVTVVRGRVDGRGPVVVGVDGSERAEAALEYGFGYADRHGLPLVALCVYAPGVFTYPVLPYPMPQYPVDDELARLHEDAARVAGESLDRWKTKYPGVDARAEVAEGPAAQHLVEASSDAALLVVGTRGHGGLAGMLLGSVSHAVVRHAHCPVTVAR